MKNRNPYAAVLSHPTYRNKVVSRSKKIVDFDMEPEKIPVYVYLDFDGVLNSEEHPGLDPRIDDGLKQAVFRNRGCHSQWAGPVPEQTFSHLHVQTLSELLDFFREFGDLRVFVTDKTLLENGWEFVENLLFHFGLTHHLIVPFPFQENEVAKGKQIALHFASSAATFGLILSHDTEDADLGSLNCYPVKTLFKLPLTKVSGLTLESTRALEGIF